MLELIPQDVVDIIISHLGDDNDALKQCSLTSHSCLATSRKHLFSNVSLYSAQRCQQLDNLLTTNPSLAAYMRHVLLDGKQKIFDPRRSHCWVSEPTLPTVLNIITPRLQSLALYHIYWGELPQELQRVLICTLHTPNIQSITLVSVHKFPTNYLLHLPHLRRLSLLSLSGAAGCSPRINVHPPVLEKQQLQVLEFDQRAKSIKCVIELKQLWDLSHLRELYITGSCSRMLNVASAFTVSASKSLELLAWHYQYSLRVTGEPNEPMSQDLNISGLSALRFLFLRSTLHEGLVDLLPWLVQSLSPLRENLEHVVVVLNCDQDDRSSACVQRMCESHIWSELDAALMQAPKASLDVMVRRIQMNRGGDHTATPDPRKIIARQMPLLSNAGLLQIEVDDWRSGPFDATWDRYKRLMRCSLWILPNPA